VWRLEMAPAVLCADDPGRPECAEYAEAPRSGYVLFDREEVTVFDLPLLRAAGRHPVLRPRVCRPVRRAVPI